MRKLVLSAVALCFTLGLTLAGEVTFVKFDKDAKKLTVKDGDKESTYTITDDTKFKAGDKDVPAEKALPRFEKMKEGGKFMIEVDGKKLTEVKMPERKKK